MWNDNETKEDLIDFHYLVNSINSILDNDRLVPSTIGIYGGWGSGKSSLMKLIEHENEKKDNIVIKFNGWLFEGYEDAKTALLSNLIDELIKNRTWDGKAKKYLGRLIKKVKWLKVLSTTSKIGLNTYLSSSTDFDYSNVLNEISNINVDDYIKNIQSEESELIEKGVREFRLDFAELIKETKAKRLVVLIDDLDRCNPDTIISTLEAIKLFLFAEKSIFLISADERLINYAVKKRFPELPSQEYDVSKDYLEKLIQFPIRIPSLNESEFETYINLLFCKIHLETSKFNTLRTKIFELSPEQNKILDSRLNAENINNYLDDVPELLKEDLILSKQINPILVSILSGNPRQCKRFLNLLMIRLNMAKSKGIELKKNVLAKLMLLEYFKTESFNKLVRSTYESDDTVMKFLESDTDDVPNTFKGWQTDIWLQKWIDIDPKLSGIDLKLYFYFTRGDNKIDFISNKRLSPEAKEILKGLLSGTTSLKNKAISASESIPKSDILIVFSEVTNRILTEEDLKNRGELNKILVQYCKKHEILISEYCAFIEKTPESILMPANAANLMLITKDTGFEQNAKTIIQKWTDSSNTILAKAAKKQLK